MIYIWVNNLKYMPYICLEVLFLNLYLSKFKAPTYICVCVCDCIVCLPNVLIPYSDELYSYTYEIITITKCVLVNILLR